MLPQQRLLKLTEAPFGRTHEVGHGGALSRICSRISSVGIPRSMTQTRSAFPYWF